MEKGALVNLLIFLIGLLLTIYVLITPGNQPFLSLLGGALMGGGLMSLILKESERRESQ